MKLLFSFFLIVFTCWSQTQRLSEIDANGGLSIAGSTTVSSTSSGLTLLTARELGGVLQNYLFLANSASQGPVLAVTGGATLIGAEQYAIWAGGNLSPLRDNTYALGGTETLVPPSFNRWANIATVQVNGDTWPAANAVGALNNDGAGNLSWTNGGPSGCPAGNSWQIQYYTGAGVCAASAQLKWFGTDGTLDIVNGPTLSAPALSISQSGGNATGRIVSISDASNTEVFGINGAGAGALENYVFANGMLPHLDNLYSLGAGNAAWKSAYSYSAFAVIDYLCGEGNGVAIFPPSSCWTVEGSSIGNPADFIISAPANVENSTMLFLKATGTPANDTANFAASLLPSAPGAYSLGTSGEPWGNTYTGALVVTGPLLSIDSVLYTWPAANAAGFLQDDGLGNLSWEPAVAGGVTKLNGLTGNLSIAGTTNEINVSPGGSTITLSTPQGIATSSSPTFSSMTLGGILTINGGVIEDLGAGIYFPGAVTFQNGFSISGNVGGNLTPGSILYTLGTPGSPWQATYTNEISPTTGTLLLNGYLEPTAPGYLLGTSGIPWGTAYITSGIFGGGAAGIGVDGVALTCSPPMSTYFASGAAGQSKTVTVRNAAGTGTCTIIYTCGIVTGGTC